ncbi:cathepsin G-like [Equus asinus]|uniref:cathepsin G-like n=1 Tax=Equus asinus TaxID=9793 RepID=UPI0038F79181
MKDWQEEAPAATHWAAFLGRCTPSCSSWPFSSPQLWGSHRNVILGAHNMGRLESTQQRISVLRVIRHPGYDQQNNLNDLILLQRDTTGPLVCHHEAQGLISYGNRMQTPPAVFTSVSSFLLWMWRTMRRFKQRGQTETPPVTHSSLWQRTAPEGLLEP